MKLSRALAARMTALALAGPLAAGVAFAEDDKAAPPPFGVIDLSPQQADQKTDETDPDATADADAQTEEAKAENAAENAADAVETGDATGDATAENEAAKEETAEEETAEGAAETAEADAAPMTLEEIARALGFAAAAGSGAGVGDPDDATDGTDETTTDATADDAENAVAEEMGAEETVAEDAADPTAPDEIAQEETTDDAPIDAATATEALDQNAVDAALEDAAAAFEAAAEQDPVNQDPANKDADTPNDAASTNADAAQFDAATTDAAGDAPTHRGLARAPKPSDLFTAGEDADETALEAALGAAEQASAGATDQSTETATTDSETTDAAATDTAATATATTTTDDAGDGAALGSATAEETVADETTATVTVAEDAAVAAPETPTLEAEAALRDETVEAADDAAAATTTSETEAATATNVSIDGDAASFDQGADGATPLEATDASAERVGPAPSVAEVAAAAINLRKDGLHGATLIAAKIDAGAFDSALPGVDSAEDRDLVWSYFFRASSIDVATTADGVPIAIFHNPFIDAWLTVEWRIAEGVDADGSARAPRGPSLMLRRAVVALGEELRGASADDATGAPRWMGVRGPRAFTELRADARRGVVALRSRIAAAEGEPDLAQNLPSEKQRRLFARRANALLVRLVRLYQSPELLRPASELFSVIEQERRVDLAGLINRTGVDPILARSLDLPPIARGDIQPVTAIDDGENAIIFANDPRQGRHFFALLFQRTRGAGPALRVALPFEFERPARTADR